MFYMPKLNAPLRIRHQWMSSFLATQWPRNRGAHFPPFHYYAKSQRYIDGGFGPDFRLPRPYSEKSTDGYGFPTSRKDLLRAPYPDAEVAHARYRNTASLNRDSKYPHISFGGKHLFLALWLTHMPDFPNAMGAGTSREAINT